MSFIIFYCVVISRFERFLDLKIRPWFQIGIIFVMNLFCHTIELMFAYVCFIYYSCMHHLILIGYVTTLAVTFLIWVCSKRILIYFYFLFNSVYPTVYNYCKNSFYQCDSILYLILLRSNRHTQRANFWQLTLMGPLNIKTGPNS